MLETKKLLELIKRPPTVENLQRAMDFADACEVEAGRDGLPVEETRPVYIAFYLGILAGLDIMIRSDGIRPPGEWGQDDYARLSGMIGDECTVEEAVRNVFLVGAAVK